MEMCVCMLSHMCISTHIYIYMHIYIYLEIFTKLLGNNDNSIAMSIPGAQILASNSILQLKEPEEVN